MIQSEHATNTYLQHTAKAKLNKQLFGAVTYFLVIIAIGASLTLFAVSGKLDDDETLLVIISSLLYGTAVIAMIWIMIYTSQNQYASLEAMEASVFTGSKIKFSGRGDATHCLLRFGLCFFASVSVSYCVAHCYEITVERKVTAGNVILHTFLVFFLIIQACFILLFHKFIIFTDSRQFKYLFMHLAAVNLCALVQISSMNVFVYRNADDRQYRSEWSFTISSALQYLYPAMVEFCTIAAVILWELARCSGHIDKVKPRKSEIGLPKRSGRLIWKIIGWTMVASTVIFMVAMEIIGYRLGSVRHILHMAEVELFTLLALTLVGVSLKLVRRLKFTVSYSRKRVEEVLLIVTAGLAIVYFVACIFLAAGYICKGSAKSDLDVQLLRFQIALSILQLLHVLLQTYLLQDNLYRCCDNENSLNNRPGRPFLVLLTFVNISIWVIHSFQVIKNDRLHEFSKDNSIMDNMGAIFTVVQLTLPMVMLYYFISAVCILVAIRHAYTEEAARYDRRQQWRNVSNNTSVLPFLEAHAKPFATGDARSDLLAYENRADAFFQDITMQSIPGRPSDEQYPTSQVGKDKSGTGNIQRMTANVSSTHTAHSIGKEEAGGRMEDHQPLDSHVGFWDQHDDDTSKSRKSGKEIDEIHKPPVKYGESDGSGLVHPAMGHRRSTRYKKTGVRYNKAEENVQPTIDDVNEQPESTLHVPNESEEKLKTNPFLESLGGINAFAETSNSPREVDVGLDSGGNFVDDIKKIIGVQEPLTRQAFDVPDVKNIVQSDIWDANKEQSEGAAQETTADVDSHSG